MGFDKQDSGHGRRSGEDMGRLCTEARSKLASFFDWAGMSDARKRVNWEAWVTKQVLSGRPVDESVEYVKSRWYAHRQSSGLPMKCEQVSTRGEHDALFAVCYAILQDKLSPAHAAVMFRAVLRQYPTSRAARLCVERAEGMGNAWHEAEA